jgi:CRP-like cAMP-binding protein
VSPRHVPASVTELQRVGLFGSLPGETIAKLAERMVREEVAQGRAIVTGDEPTDRFYVLLSGLATVTRAETGAGALLRPGETFGRGAAPTGSEGPVSVSALTSCVVASCDRPTFDELVQPLYMPD